MFGLIGIKFFLLFFPLERKAAGSTVTATGSQRNAVDFFNDSLGSIVRHCSRCLLEIGCLTNVFQLRLSL